MGLRAAYELGKAGLKEAVPGIVGNTAGQVAGAPGAVGKAALGDGTFTQYDNQATATNAAPESAQIGVDAVQALPASNQKANIGIDQAARIESELATPTGKTVKESGLNANVESDRLVQETHQDYNDAVKGAIQATQNAETALNKAADNAKINPQEYLETLGVGGKLMTAIGMVLSGIGSGVTGQPNLAMQMYQKNMDAAIQAQAAKFNNLMQVSAQKQGLIKTAQDKQQIAANAYNAAVMSVATGANVAIQGLLTQTAGATATARGAQLQNLNNIQNSGAIDNHSTQFSSRLQSGDAGKVTLMGQGLQPIIDYLSGKKPNPAAKGVSVDKRVGRPLPQGTDPNGDPLPPKENSFNRDLKVREAEQRLKEQDTLNDKGFANQGNGAYPKAGDFLEKYGAGK